MSSRRYHAQLKSLKGASRGKGQQNLLYIVTAGPTEKSIIKKLIKNP